MFLGTHTPRLDDKGRLTVPSKFRAGLAEGVVMTKGQERSIVLWPAAEFTAYADRIREASRSDAKVRAYSRVFFSSATDTGLDRQGRVLVPPQLRDYAGLTDDCVVVGNHTTVEVWNPKAWQSYLSRSEPEFVDLNEEVVPGIF